MAKAKRKGTPNELRKKFTKLTPETIKKLEEVFSMDGSIGEACYYADITNQTYYNWIKENPEMKERFDKLREKPILKARQIVMQRMSDSYQNAMDYLKRKKRLEFGDNVDHTSGGQNITPILVEFINKNEKDDKDTK